MNYWKKIGISLKDIQFSSYYKNENLNDLVITVKPSTREDYH